MAEEDEMRVERKSAAEVGEKRILMFGLDMKNEECFDGYFVCFAIESN